MPTLRFRDLEERDANDPAFIREMVEGEIGNDVDFEVIECEVKEHSSRKLSQRAVDDEEAYLGLDGFRKYRVKVKYRVL